MPKAVQFVTKPTVHAHNDQRKNTYAQEAAHSTAAPGVRPQTQAHYSPKAGTGQGRHETQTERGQDTGQEAQVPDPRWTPTQPQGNQGTKRGRPKKEGNPDVPFGESPADQTGQENRGDGRKILNEDRKKQLEEARKRAVEVRQEKAAVKRQEKELRDALFEQKKREIQEMKEEAIRDKRYKQEPQFKDPPSPPALAPIKPQLPSPFKKGSRPRLQSIEPPLEDKNEPDEPVKDDEVFHADKKAKLDEDEEKERLRIMEEEMMREEEERAIAREEFRAKLRKEAREKHLAELEEEKRKATENLYKKKMEENRIKLLTQQIFGTF